MATDVMARIENWSLAPKEPYNGYSAPETIRLCVFGDVYDHPRRENGGPISTSYVVDIQGRTVTTYSGSKYTLGTPSVEYAKWCGDHGYTVPQATGDLAVPNK